MISKFWLAVGCSRYEPDLRQLNRLQIIVTKAMNDQAGIVDDGTRELQAKLLALVVTKRAQAMAR